MAERIGMRQRCLDGHDATHGLRNDGAAGNDVGAHALRQIVQPVYGRICRIVAETGPAIMDPFGRTAQGSGDGLPERGVAGSAGKKQEF